MVRLVPSLAALDVRAAVGHVRVRPVPDIRQHRHRIPAPDCSSARNMPLTPVPLRNELSIELSVRSNVLDTFR